MQGKNDILEDVKLNLVHNKRKKIKIAGIGV